jgi:hypothetical protein
VAGQNNSGQGSGHSAKARAVRPLASIKYKSHGHLCARGRWFKQENTWLLLDHRRTQSTTTTDAILNIKLCAILS